MERARLLLLFYISFVVDFVVVHASGLGSPEVCGIISEEGSSLPELSDGRYAKVIEPTLSPAHLQDLPGYTRSVFGNNHAIIAPESRVFGPLSGWSRTSAAFLISPAMGSHFSMYIANMEGNSSSGQPAHDIERFVFVIKGELVLSPEFEESQKLLVDSFVYFPPNLKHSILALSSSTIIVYERRYQQSIDGLPNFVVGSTDMQPVLETHGEDFVLRKLLPMGAEYDFNVHVMDFQPGEYLNVKEVHYNQHGLLMLEGRGIYRLGDNWYPVQAGDVIWMAPFVPQWYGALGRTRTRYLLYKDMNRDPLLGY